MIFVIFLFAICLRCHSLSRLCYHFRVVTLLSSPSLVILPCISLLVPTFLPFAVTPCFSHSFLLVLLLPSPSWPSLYLLLSLFRAFLFLPCHPFLFRCYSLRFFLLPTSPLPLLPLFLFGLYHSFPLPFVYSFP